MDQLAPKQCVNVDNHRVTAEAIRGRAQGRAVEQQPGWETAEPRVPQDLAVTECSMIWIVDSLVKLHDTVMAAPLRRAAQVSNPGLLPEAYRPGWLASHKMLECHDEAIASSLLSGDPSVPAGM